MIIIEKKVNLAEHTTLKIGGPARYYVEIGNKSELLEALSFAKNKKSKIFILGGGSNTFFSDYGFPGLIIKNKIRGIRLVKETKDHVWVEADSGEWWATLVDYCVSHKYFGAENLFLIPGSVGAAPIQNIGAYGAELKDIFSSLVVINLHTLKERKFLAKDCHFGYRQSIFKNKLKDKYFIYSVTLRLNKKPHWNLTHPELYEKLKNYSPETLTARDLVKAIMQIRNSKLPIPALLPNAGSFYKNPELDEKNFLKFIKRFPEVKYAKTGKKYRLAAGWLIDECGFKGKKFKTVGVYEKQALVLVNFGRAKSKDLMALARKIEGAVKKKFGLKLEKEVNFIE